MAILDIFNRKKENYKGIDLDPNVDPALQKQLIDRGRTSEIQSLSPTASPLKATEIISDTAQVIGKGAGYALDAAEYLTTKQLPLGQLQKKVAPQTLKNNKVIPVMERADAEILDTINKTPAIKSFTRGLTEGVSDIPIKILSAIESLRPDVTYDQAVKSWQSAKANPENPLWKTFAYSLQDAGAKALVGILVSRIPIAGTTLASTYWGSISADEQFQSKGKITNYENILVDVFGDQMLGNSIEGLFKKPAASTLKALNRTGLVEGGTEVLQTFVKLHNDYRKAKSSEEKAQIIKEAKEYVTSGQMLMEFGVGYTTGAGIGAGAHVLGANSSIGEYINKDKGIPTENVVVSVEKKKEVLDFAEQRLTALKNKADGVHTMDDKGQKIFIEPQVLTNSEVNELKFLKSNSSDPIAVMSHYTIKNNGNPASPDNNQDLIAQAVNDAQMNIGEQPDIYQEAVAQARQSVIAEPIEDEADKKQLYHRTSADVEMIKDRGFNFGKNSVFGEAAFFADNADPTYGDNQIEIASGDYNLKTFKTVKEERAYIEAQGAKNLADAVRKEGIYDGFILPNKHGSDVYGITNKQLLDRKLKSQQYITADEARQISKQFKFIEALDLPVVAVERILTPQGKEALGKYYNGMISFIENPHKTTVPHEAVHAYIDLMLDDKQKKTILDEVRRRYPGKKLNSRDAEEQLAQDFERYYVAKQTKGAQAKAPSSKLKQLFDWLIDNIKKLLKNVDIIDQLFKDIETKKPGIFQRAAIKQKIIERGDYNLHDLQKEYYQNPDTLTSKFLKNANLQGKDVVSFQFLKDLAQSKTLSLKNAERQLINDILDTQFAGKNKISITDFSNAVRSELMPLEVIESPIYSGFGADALGKDDTEGYQFKTHIYNSPFLHGYNGHFRYAFESQDAKSGLFGHARLWDDQLTNIRYVAEIQSDAFQNVQKIASRQDKYFKQYETADQAKKAYIGGKAVFILPTDGTDYLATDLTEIDTAYSNGWKAGSEKDAEAGADESMFLKFKNNWHERIIREEIRLAAIMNKSVLRFPTPYTVARIQGYLKGQIPTETQIGESFDYVGDRYILLDKQFGGKAGIAVPADAIIGRFDTLAEAPVYSEKFTLDNGQVIAIDPNVETEILSFGAQSSKQDFSPKKLSPAHQSIVRLYQSEIPSYLKKLRGRTAPIVTDENNYDWYELDILPSDREAVEAFQTKPAEATGSFSGKAVADHINEIEVDKGESEGIDDHLRSVVEAQNFELTTIKIKSLIESDQDLANYVAAGEQRYPENFNTYEKNPFPESKVQQVVYHGSQSIFKAGDFDLGRAGDQGFSEGRGFYFTDDKGVATDYTKNKGKLFEVYLNITKPMDAIQRKITDVQIRKILEAAYKIDEEALSNFGDFRSDGKNRVIAEAVKLLKENETDLDLVSELGTVLSGPTFQETNDIIRKVTGYDGVVTQWNEDPDRAPINVFVAFSPDQIVEKSTIKEDASDTANLPIVVGYWNPETQKDFGVLDGWNRVLTKVQNGDESIEAFVAETPKYQEADDHGGLLFNDPAQAARLDERRTELNDARMKEMLDLEAEILDARYADNRFFIVEQETGYQNFKKLANRRPWMLDNSTDEQHIKDRLTKINIDDQLFSGAGGDLTNNELLEMFKDRYQTEMSQFEIAKLKTPFEQALDDKKSIERMVKKQTMGRNMRAKQAINVAMGVEDPKIITAKETTLLKKQIRDIARGVKMGRSSMREALLTVFRASKVSFSNQLASKAEIAQSKAVRAEQLKSLKAGIKMRSKFESRIENMNQDKILAADVKKAIINYAADLPANEKGKMLPMISRANSQKDLAKAMMRIDAALQKVDKAEQLEALRGTADDIKQALRSGKGIAVDYQRQLAEIIKDYDLKTPTNKTLNRLKGLKDYLDSNPGFVPDHLVKQLDRLSKTNVGQMTGTQIKELNDLLNRLMNLGHLKMQLKNTYNERARQANLQKLLDSTTSIDPKGDPSKKGFDVKESKKRMILNTFHAFRVADMIDGNGDYLGQNVRMQQQINLSVNKAMLRADAIVTDAFERIKALKNRWSEKEQAVIYFHLLVQQGAHEQANALATAQKWTEAPKLTEEMATAMDVMRGAFKQSQDYLASVYEEIENKIFEMQDNYFPLKYVTGKKEIPEPTIGQKIIRSAKTEQGFTFKRLPNVKRVVRTDVFAVFEEAIREQQYYMNVQPALSEVRNLVNDQQYQDKAGRLAIQWWRDYIDAISNRGQMSGVRSNAWLRRRRIALSRAVLGFKLSSVLMQPMAIFDAISYIQMKYGQVAAARTLTHFVSSWVNPMYARKVLAASPALQLRRGNAGELSVEELQGVTKRDSAGAFLTKAALGPISWADLKTAAAVDQAIYNTLKAQGVSDAEARAEADMVMNIVSGSSEIGNRPMVLMSGEGARTLFTFQTFMLNRWGLIAHDLISSGLIKGKLGRKAKALFGLFILAFAGGVEQKLRDSLYEFISGKESKIESNFWRDGFLSIPEAIPVIGQLVQSITNPSLGFSIPLARVSQQLVTGINQVNSNNQETQAKGWLKIGEAIATYNGIWGAAQVSDLIERGITNSRPGLSGSELAPMPELPELPDVVLPPLPELPELPRI